MDNSTFKRLMLDGKLYFQLSLVSNDPDNKSCLVSWNDDDAVVPDATITINADALCQAISAFTETQAYFDTVGIYVDVASKNFDGCLHAAKIVLSWVGNDLNCEFETTDEYTGLLFWLDLAPYFPTPLTKLTTV